MGRRDLLGFSAALISYVALGVIFKSWVLNWIVGPLYLVLVLHFLPAAASRLVRKSTE